MHAITDVVMAEICIPQHVWQGVIGDSDEYAGQVNCAHYPQVSTRKRALGKATQVCFPLLEIMRHRRLRGRRRSRRIAHHL